MKIIKITINKMTLLNLCIQEIKYRYIDDLPERLQKIIINQCKKQHKKTFEKTLHLIKLLEIFKKYLPKTDIEYENLMNYVL